MSTISLSLHPWKSTCMIKNGHRNKIREKDSQILKMLKQWRIMLLQYRYQIDLSSTTKVDNTTQSQMENAYQWQ